MTLETPAGELWASRGLVDSREAEKGVSSRSIRGGLYQVVVMLAEKAGQRMGDA
jgi:hypothetical protein